MELTKKGKMMVAGHRGDSANYPENTMAAFRAAKEQGFGIELDLQLTADGQVVVFHDLDLLRQAFRGNDPHNPGELRSPALQDRKSVV